MRVKGKKKKKKKKTPPTGLEPAIFGSQIWSHQTTDRRPTPYPLGHGGGMWVEVEKGHYQCQLDCNGRSKRGYQRVRQAATRAGDCICQTQTAKR